MAGESSGVPAKPALILVVEDEEPIRFMVTEGLTSAGYSILEAANAIEAIKVLDEHPIDLVFTDVRMPGTMDGAHLAFLIETRWPAVKIIVGSGNFDPKARRLPRGSSFLSKPYRLSALTDLIEQCLEA